MNQDPQHHAEQDPTLAVRRDLSEIVGLATDDRTARIILALGCEPGDELAAQLVAQHGALGLVRQITDDTMQDQTLALARWRHDVAGRLNPAEVSRALLQTRHLKLSALIPGDPSWPTLAGPPAAHPLVLWTHGDASRLVAHAPRVAVIGARSPTEYGTHVTRTIAAGLADQGVTILGSGSPGIDSTAALGAVVAGGPVIAVLPQGLDRPYPSGNSNLYRTIRGDGGVLVSACPPGRVTGRARARVRDGLVAALADAVVVTEAAHRSPALKIAQEALRLGVPVGAVPGPVLGGTSDGANELLREHTARLITHATDAMSMIAARSAAPTATAGRSPGYGASARRPQDGSSNSPAWIPL
jgi:DNA processing protein